MATKNKLEDELDALFKVPLTEFTVARNALAARLKKAGNRDESDRVKALSKPTLSAWAVNQLYWTHGDAFKELIAPVSALLKLTICVQCSMRGATRSRL